MAENAKDVMEKYGASGVEPPATVIPSESSVNANVVEALAAIDSSEDQLLLGQELATIFKDNEVHPVLIFGSKGSGKTAFLASMFRYMMNSPDSGGSLELREDIFPAEDTRWSKHISWARNLFYKKVIDYAYSKAPSATLEENPFFIPVKLTRTTGEEASFAFLEGKGEWYMPEHGAEVPFRRFHGFLQGLLQQFSSPVTVIYVAPYTTGGYVRTGGIESARSENIRNSDLGLLGAINEFVALRRAQFHRDAHLFLMSKWDIACEGISSSEFNNPSGDLIQKIANERFNMSWSRFQKLNFPDGNSNKTFSVYCSGIIDDNSVLKPAQDDVEVVDKYPRKLWDWIHVKHTGQHLYADMMPKRKGFLDRFIDALRG